MNSARVIAHWRPIILQAYRCWSGNQAYQDYLAHWHAHHAEDGGQPLNRRDFFRERTLSKWRGIQRCC